MLSGKKIQLRAVEPSDLKQILNWENDPEYWQVSGTLVPFSEELIKLYVHSAQDIYQTRQIRLIVLQKETGKAIGAVDLFDFDPRHQRAGLGILIDKEFRGKGYGHETIELVKKYASEVVGIRNLWASVLSDNPASIKLFESCNFERCGLRKSWFNKGKDWLDEIQFQCLLIA